MNNRRSFLKATGLITSSVVLSNPLQALSSVSKNINTISFGRSGVTVFHTNDLHGQLGKSWKNFGGLSQIKKDLQNQDKGGVVVDAGDFLDKKHSRSEHLDTIYAMNQAGYHAATLGNHELAMEPAYLAELASKMQFDLVNCNYKFENTQLQALVKPYTILHYGKIKVGITGVGLDHNITGISFSDPYQSANRVAKHLKETENCNIVICLSHLGFGKGEVNNTLFAAASEHIDFIAGGHNNSMMGSPMVLKNQTGHDIFVSHVGQQGLMVGKVSFSFNSEKQLVNIEPQHFITGLSANESFAKNFYKIREEQAV